MRLDCGAVLWTKGDEGAAEVEEAGAACAVGAPPPRCGCGVLNSNPSFDIGGAVSVILTRRFFSVL